MSRSRRVQRLQRRLFWFRLLRLLDPLLCRIFGAFLGIYTCCAGCSALLLPFIPGPRKECVPWFIYWIGPLAMGCGMGWAAIVLDIRGAARYPQQWDAEIQQAAEELRQATDPDAVPDTALSRAQNAPTASDRSLSYGKAR